LRSTAAATSAAKSGCARVGRDFSNQRDVSAYRHTGYCRRYQFSLLAPGAAGSDEDKRGAATTGM